MAFPDLRTYLRNPSASLIGVCAFGGEANALVESLQDAMLVLGVMRWAEVLLLFMKSNVDVDTRFKHR